MIQSIDQLAEDTASSAGDQRINRAVDRAVEILLYVAKKKSPVSLAEVSNNLSIPKSSAFDILHTLVHKRVLKMDEDSKTFQLDVRAFEIGSAFLGGNEIHTVARPLLKRISQQTGETSFLAVENNGMIVYLDKVEGKSPTRTTCVIGDRNTMHSTGLGKAILSTKSIEDVRLITGGGRLQVKTANTLTHFDDLMRELEKTRQRGYSIDDREDVDLVFCVGAPILDQNAKCIAAVSIAVFYTSSTLGNTEFYSKLVTGAAMEISRCFGFTGNSIYAF